MSMAATNEPRRKALNPHATDPLEEQVLLATDGGPAGRAATRWIADRARSHVLNVEVIDVVDAVEGDGQTEWTGEQAEWLEDPREPAAERATEWATDNLAWSAPSVEAHRRVAVGDPRDLLVRAAKYADLLVIGTNRAVPASPHLRASFSSRVAESTPCPTVVVPRWWKRSEGPVVAGVEGGSGDAAVLEFAAKEAEVLGRDLVLVHARLLAMIGRQAGGRASAAELSRHATSFATTTRLSGAANQIRLRHPMVRMERAAPGSDVIRAIRDASLVVVGSHGITTIDRLLMNWVSSAVLDCSSCPIAVVPPSALPD